jgi:phosphatidate cytidylyltransferase
VIGQRIASALVIAAILLAAVFLLPAEGLAAVLSLVLLAAAWEWSAFVAGPQSVLRWSFLAVTLVTCVLLWFASGSPRGLMACVVAGLVLWVLALLWLMLVPQRLSRTVVYLAGVAAIAIAWICLTRISVGQPRGNLWVLYALLIVWVADSGAYFVGRSWGVSRLAPRISPGKTWAGLWGGILASALLAGVVSMALRLPVVGLVTLTVVVASYSVIGDLTESMCKRFAGMKDSGRLIPGHGGVLDRFDSLLAAAPCLLFGLLAIKGLS